MSISDWSSDVCSSDLSITQEYVRNSPILRTRQMDDQGNIVETLDFCPRFKRKGRIYRPVAFVRVVRPVAGSPRIRVRLRPITAWGQGQPAVRYGSNHIRLPLSSMAMRLSTDAPIGLIAPESAFRLAHDCQFFLGDRKGVV